MSSATATREVTKATSRVRSRVKLPEPVTDIEPKTTLIADRSELIRFIEWIRPLKPWEAYLLQIQVRGSGLKEKYGFKGTDHSLRQEVIPGYLQSRVPTGEYAGWELWRLRLLEKIEHLAVLGAQAPWYYIRYKPGTREVEKVIRVPPPLISLYIQLNPGDIVKAIRDVIGEMIEAYSNVYGLAMRAMEEGRTLEALSRAAIEEYRRPDTRFRAAIARRAKTRFHVVDIDTRELAEEVGEMLLEAFGFLPARITTRRGAHYLIELPLLQERGLIKKWVHTKTPPKVARAIGEYKSLKCYATENRRCLELRRVIEEYIRDPTQPLYYRLQAASAIYVDERGTPLIEIKKQALEPVPGTIYKKTIVRFKPEES